ncbi:hypothetical protein [Actinokineospora sp.]|uniref:hypothetical protein n=1 Tax=Actinokineospora sp. TaxID=1872133 RepID=UPI0040382754
MTGRRVRWCGSTQPRLTTTAYQARVRAGSTRPPGADDLPDLCAGDEGVVGELIAVAPGGVHLYLIRWDSGTEIETNLPSRLVEEVDQPDHPTPVSTGSRTYASFPATRRSRVLAAVSRTIRRRSTPGR